MIDKTTARRLLKLCDHMESLPKGADKHFNMDTFIAHEGDHEHPLPKRQRDLLTCGTTACALGWATTMPYFRKLGVKFDSWGVVQGDDEVFTLTDDQWSALFERHNKDKTPRAWAKRVRKLLKQWSAA